MSTDFAFSYQKMSAFGASPVGQVVALYDSILRDFHQALAAIEAADVERRVNVANHALTVIGELQGVLDFQRGGDAARNLSRFYTVTRPMIVEASLTSSREKFRELITLFTRIRSAWSQIERTVVPPVAPEAARNALDAPAPFVQKDGAAPLCEPSRSGWRA